MDPTTLRALLQAVQRGRLTVGQALGRLKYLPFESLGWATVDHHRHLRLGFPEVILGEAKSVRQIVALARSLLRRGASVLVTRVDPVTARAVCRALPRLRYHAVARVLAHPAPPRSPQGAGLIAVVCAGTGDVPVAEEAAITATLMGNRVARIYDVGVAGLHRLLVHQPTLTAANVLVVVAGMEGALPSVVGGLVSKPVIAVPTSVGYGASFQGLAALLAMLNSCASGILVVNIDNGFGAATAASRILMLGAKTSA